MKIISDNYTYHFYSSRAQVWTKQVSNGSQYHRENDLPAYISCTGTQEWFVEDRRRRDSDNPTIIYSNGFESYWIND